MGILSWATWMGPKWNHKCPYKGKAERDYTQAEVEEGYVRMKAERDVKMLLALKTEEGAMSQRVRLQNAKVTDSSLDPLARVQPYQHLGFSPVRPFWASDL